MFIDISTLPPPDSGKVWVGPRTKVPLPARLSSSPALARLGIGACHRSYR